MKHGREDADWDALVTETRHILEETASREGLTSYKPLNAELQERTGLDGFDLSSERGRADMGHLLGEVATESFADHSVLLSALVHYMNENMPGPGFFSLAVELGLHPATTSPNAKLDFWAKEVGKVHSHYRRSS